MAAGVMRYPCTSAAGKGSGSRRLKTVLEGSQGVEAQLLCDKNKQRNLQHHATLAHCLRKQTGASQDHGEMPRSAPTSAQAATCLSRERRVDLGGYGSRSDGKSLSDPQ